MKKIVVSLELIVSIVLLIVRWVAEEVLHQIGVLDQLGAGASQVLR